MGAIFSPGHHRMPTADSASIAAAKAVSISRRVMSKQPNSDPRPPGSRGRRGSRRNSVALDQLGCTNPNPIAARRGLVGKLNQSEVVIPINLGDADGQVRLV